MVCSRGWVQVPRAVYAYGDQYDRSFIKTAVGYNSTCPVTETCCPPFLQGATHAENHGRPNPALYELRSFHYFVAFNIILKTITSSVT